MLFGFTGEYQQKVDGKGRMSIPAEFRRVLEEGDPTARAEGRNPSLFVQHGPMLEGKRLRVVTLEAHAENYRTITSTKPVDQKGKKVKAYAQLNYLSRVARLEVDRDGRVVMPLLLRKAMGVEEGEVIFAGMGDAFEIWPADRYETEMCEALVNEFKDLGPDYDPMVDIWAMAGS